MMNIQNWPTITFTFSIPENTEKKVSIGAYSKKYGIFLDWGDGVVIKAMGGSALQHTYTSANITRTITITIKGDLRCLNLGSLEITSLHTEQHPILQELYIASKVITTLDVSKSPSLTRLGVASYSMNGNLTALDVSNCTQLNTLNCQSNALTTLDVSNCTQLINLYCWGNALSSLDLSYNLLLEELLCYNNPFTKMDDNTGTPILQKIGGIDGYMRSIRNYQLGKVAGDYDFTNYSFKTDTCDLAVETDGIVDVNEYINRKHLYSTNWNNNGINSWSIKASLVRVHTADGKIISDKKSFYDRIASIVAEENLYDYPQLCKILTPAFDLRQTRDNYATHKILLCDSGNNSLWQNGRGTFGVETPINHISWVPTKDIYKNYVTTPVFYCRVVVRPNATFYITVISSRYTAYDNKQRAICNAGELSVTNGAEIISNSYNDLTNQTEYVIKFDIVNPINSVYYAHFLYLYEDKYPTAADPYETRIISFEKVKE